MKHSYPPAERNLFIIRFISLIPVLLYFTYFSLFSINAPQNDDFQTILKSAVTFDPATDIPHWLTTQYGEHRIACVRFVAVLVQQLTGSVNFVWIGFIGNLSLVGVLVILFLWFRKQKIDQYFLPVPFILFQMNYHHDTFVSMMAVQNLSILFWAVLTFWYVTQRTGWQTLVGSIPALLAVYTSGNGFLIVLIAVILLAFSRQWKPLLL